MRARKQLFIFGAFAAAQIAAATCLNSCPFVPFDNYSADPAQDVLLIPSGNATTEMLQQVAGAANAALTGTGFETRYQVGERYVNGNQVPDVTPVQIQFITDKSFFGTKFTKDSETVAFISKGHNEGQTEVVEATIYVNLTASCGNTTCLNPNVANYAQAVENLLLHEGLGHLFGLNDSVTASSMMGPGNGGVNDTTANRAPNACDVGALEMRRKNQAEGNRSCGILSL